MFFKSNRKARSNSEPLVLNIAPAAGLFAGTMIGTPYRWAPVEELQVGDDVLTAENGKQTIIGIERGELSVASAKAAAGQWPLLVPEGALGNEQAMLVAPTMRLVIEDAAAGMLFGENCVSAKAEALIGHKGIARARVRQALEHVTLVFDEPQTLVGQGGVFFDVPDMNGVSSFPALGDREARLLVRHLGESDRKRRSRAITPAWI